ncbi:MAG: hypothetical protein MJ153_04555 [Clostridia bacterium]|nr:hypothetical protein [Clostridia bacterium]
MLSHNFYEAYRIDDLNRKWGARVLFLVLLCFELSLYFAPIGDSNFDAFNEFFERVTNNPENYLVIKPSDVPLTSGNMIYVAFGIFVIAVMIIGAIIYSSIFIRDFRLHSRRFAITEIPSFSITVRSVVDSREEKISQEELLKKVSSNLPECKPIKLSSMILRVLFLAFWVLVLVIPMILLTQFLFFIFILILPGLMMSVTYYVSGDKSLGDAIVTGFKHVRGNYLEYISGILAIGMSFVVVEYIIELLQESVLNPSLSYSLMAFAISFFALTLGRYMGLKHCMINDTFAQVIKNKQIM